MEPTAPQTSDSDNDRLIDWDQAVTTHSRWLRKVLYCRVGDSHAVDDMMQEIALVIARQSRDPGAVPNDPQKVAPFLYRLAVRQAADFYRKANRQSHPQPVADLEPGAREPEPLQWMLQTERDLELSSAIESLDEESREILMLKYTENWSYQQLADHLGVTPKAIERRLSRARTQMRKSLTQSNTRENHHART